MTRDLDWQLVRRLQSELGRLRQAAIEDRRAAGLSPLSGEDARQHGKALVQRVVTDHEAALAEAGHPELVWEARQDLVEALEARLFGAGSLQVLLEDESVENIDINGYRNVFVEYADGTTARVRPVAASNEELVETIQTLAAHEGLSARAFDVANVRVNLRLADGSRLYAVQSVTREPVVSIRKHRLIRVSLKDLIRLGTLDEELADFLAAAVRARKNIMVAGATGAGKTTLLRALGSEIDPQERIITVERSLELGLDEDVEAHPNAIAMEERLANAEGAGAVGMAALVRDTLRLNPSRVIVGEVLGDEVVTMLNAMTQGNDGSLSTIHANSSADAVERIATYAIQAPERLPWEATVRLVASGLDLIVFLRRLRAVDDSGTATQVRVIESVREVAGITDDGTLATNELWGPDPDEAVRRRAAVQPRCAEELHAAGWRPTESAWS
jgi:Flp pilus assembly CpaF family ATPase